MTDVVASHTEHLVRGGRVASADGTQISYLARGSGPVIVCVHGGLGTALSLLPLSNYLADDFEVVVMSCRGHGTSQWGKSAPSIEHEVEDVLAVCEAVGPISALFGYSYGAVLALETALAAPSVVPKLAIYEPPLPVTYPIPDIQRIEQALSAGRYEELLLEATPGSGGLSATELTTIRDNPLWLSNVAHAPTLIPTMKVLSGLKPTVDQYASVAMPTKLMVGTVSASYLREAADLLGGVLPKVTREVLDGQGHHVEPELLAAAIGAFARN